MLTALALALALQDEQPAPPPEGWSTSVTTLGQHFFAADLDDGPGELALSRAELRLALTRELDPRRRLVLHLRHETSLYDFEDGGGLAGTLDPADMLQRSTLGATLTTSESGDLRWLLLAYGSLGFEDASELEDGLTIGGGATVTFRVSSRFLLTAGVLGNTRLEDRPLVYPWFQLDWQPTERLHVGEEASGLGVGYAWIENMRAYASLSFTERNFRLSDDSGLSDAVLRDDEFALNGGLVWEPDSPWSLELTAGLALRTLTLLADHDELGDDHLDPAPYVALRLSYAF